MSNLNETLFSWKSHWANKQAENSFHPLNFWHEVTDLVLEGRLKFDNNPLVAIGQYAFKVPGAMEFLVARNNEGMNLEKSGNIESSIIVYEVSLADDFFGSHPYDRLRIYYEKKKWYSDAIRVCKTYIGLPDRPNGQNKSRFQELLKKLIEKENMIKK